MLLAVSYPDSTSPTILHPGIDTMPSIEVVSPNPLSPSGRIMPRDTVLWRGKKYVGKRRITSAIRTSILISVGAVLGICFFNNSCRP